MSDELTPQEKQENAWSRQGWRQVWVPATTNPDGRRRRYWARPGDDGLFRLFVGVTGPPTDFGEPHFYINGERVFRDEGHPEGPSSVPWYVIKRSRAYPSEGYPTGPSDRFHFEIKTIRLKGVRPTVRPNPHYQPPDA